MLEGDQPLGADAHRYYDELVKRFNADPKRILHVQDFWGDPFTAAGSQSPDGKAAYVQVFLSGNQGGALSLESVDALRDIIAKTPAHRASMPTSPARQLRSPISSRSATRAPTRH